MIPVRVLVYWDEGRTSGGKGCHDIETVFLQLFGRHRVVVVTSSNCEHHWKHLTFFAAVAVVIFLIVSALRVGSSLTSLNFAAELDLVLNFEFANN